MRWQTPTFLLLSSGLAHGSELTCPNSDGKLCNNFDLTGVTSLSINSTYTLALESSVNLNDINTLTEVSCEVDDSCKGIQFNNAITINCTTSSSCGGAKFTTPNKVVCPNGCNGLDITCTPSKPKTQLLNFDGAPTADPVPVCSCSGSETIFSVGEVDKLAVCDCDRGFYGGNEYGDCTSCANSQRKTKAKEQNDGQGSGPASERCQCTSGTFRFIPDSNTCACAPGFFFQVDNPDCVECNKYEAGNSEAGTLVGNDATTVADGTVSERCKCKSDTKVLSGDLCKCRVGFYGTSGDDDCFSCASVSGIKGGIPNQDSGFGKVSERCACEETNNVFNDDSNQCECGTSFWGLPSTNCTACPTGTNPKTKNTVGFGRMTERCECRNFPNEDFYELDDDDSKCKCNVGYYGTQLGSCTACDQGTVQKESTKVDFGTLFQRCKCSDPHETEVDEECVCRPGAYGQGKGTCQQCPRGTEAALGPDGIFLTGPKNGPITERCRCTYSFWERARTWFSDEQTSVSNCQQLKPTAVSTAPLTGLPIDSSPLPVVETAIRPPIVDEIGSGDMLSVASLWCAGSALVTMVVMV